MILLELLILEVNDSPGENDSSSVNDYSGVNDSLGVKASKSKIFFGIK